MKYDARTKIKYSMAQVKICTHCDDKGFLITPKTTVEQFKEMTKTSIERLKEVSKGSEVCPYCMPTKKYGNLTRKIQRLEYKPDNNPESK